MANVKKLLEYLTAVCPIWDDLPVRDLKDIEASYKAEGLSIYMDFVDSEVRDGNIIWRYNCSGCGEVHEMQKRPEKDYLYLGSEPSEEESYMKFTTFQTCAAYILQLRNTFGKEPEGARLVAKYEAGADGREVVCWFDSQFPMSYAYARMLEQNMPERWSPAAKAYLEKITKGGE